MGSFGPLRSFSCSSTSSSSTNTGQRGLGGSTACGATAVPSSCSCRNFAEIVFWFAAVYVVIGDKQVVISEPGLAGVLRQSFLATVSFGTSGPQIVGPTGQAVVAWQGVAGLLMTILSLARFVGLLPQP